MSEHDVWLKTKEEKLRSLIADEAKMMPMLDNMQATIKQLTLVVQNIFVF